MVVGEERVCEVDRRILNKTSIYIILLIAILSLYNCGKINDKEISKYNWKYGSGFLIGDFPNFDQDEIKSDTIFSNNKPVALIIYFGKEFYRDDYTLKIKSIKSVQEGIYHEKGLKK